MQQDPLIDLTDLQHRSNLRRGPAFHVAKGDDRSLVGRKPLDGLPDLSQRFTGQQPLFGDALPARRRGGPTPFRFVPGWEKPIGVHGRCVHVRPFQRREGDARPFLLASGLRPIDHDAKDPRLQRRPGLEPVEPAQHPDPGGTHRPLKQLREARIPDARGRSGARSLGFAGSPDRPYRQSRPTARSALPDGSGVTFTVLAPTTKATRIGTGGVFACPTFRSPAW